MPLLVLLAISFSALPAQAKYGDGSGTADDPYLIYDANQMNAIGADSNDWDKHFKLMADIDLNAYTGTAFNIIGNETTPFIGVFDGNDHEILNFSYSSTWIDFIGLFGRISYGAEIKDLGLRNPNIHAGTASKVGALVGELSYSSTLSGCYVEGGSVSGTGSYVGALVGFSHGTISNCYAASSAFGTGSYVGGLVGYNSGAIFSCASSGSVLGYDNVGGLTGYNDWTVYESYAHGNVSGYDTVGGLVGWNRRTIASTPSGAIVHCYATGSVAGNLNAGGLIGKNDGGGGGNSFWDMETSGQATSDGGTGKTTAEMQDPNTFIAAGWDFVGEYENGPNDDWGEPIGGGYPVLWWQLTELSELPTFSGGSGKADDPYLISTVTDLSRIGHNPRLMDAHFKLTKDIDLTGETHFIIGNGWFPFAGTFDGGGHVISNFGRYRSTGEFCKGLFGIVDGVEAEIKDLGLTDSCISGGGYQTVGLLVGRLKNGAVSGCFAERGRIEVFESDGGGLVGANNGTISNCYANVYLSGWFGTGGLVEYNGGVISNCYSRGRVAGYMDFGGLVSRNSGTVTNSFWDIETSEKTTSAGGTGLMTADMQTMSTFTNAGWDFLAESVNGTEDIWTIHDGQDYPKLVWKLVNFIGWYEVDFADFAFFANHWGQLNCSDSIDCDGADLDFSDAVDGGDLKIFCDYWLAGV